MIELLFEIADVFYVELIKAELQVFYRIISTGVCL
ncbi:hypothetical protein JOD07_002934 [Defluviitalea raffinosedens]|nr:hypothetical protein [Defluviitalea raffinosedens]